MAYLAPNIFVEGMWNTYFPVLILICITFKSYLRIHWLSIFCLPYLKVGMISKSEADETAAPFFFSFFVEMCVVCWMNVFLHGISILLHSFITRSIIYFSLVLCMNALALIPSLTVNNHALAAALHCMNIYQHSLFVIWCSVWVFCLCICF